MTTQLEVDMLLSEAHPEQDISHAETVRTDEELMDMIEKAREGLGCGDGKPGSGTGR